MYDIEKLVKVLTNDCYKVVDENGKVFPPSNGIYKLIGTTMEGNPKAKHVYTIVKNNRHDIYDKILKAFDIILPLTEPELEESYNPNVSAAKFVDKFNIVISVAEWLQIKPEETVYNDGKKYITLKPGWTDLIAAKVWKESRIPCAWSFKRVKGTIGKKRKNELIKIRGKCKEFDAKIICLIENYLSKNSDIISKVVIKNYQFDYIHTGRRHLTGNWRLAVASNLIDTKTDAIAYIQNEAKCLIRFGDHYPPIIT